MDGDWVLTKTPWLKRLETAQAEAQGQAHADLLRELRAYQIELELQNQQLRETQAQLEESRSCYAALYDHAPIPYLTLDRDGLIESLNLAATAWLGETRWPLIGFPLATVGRFEDRATLYRHLHQCRTSARRQTTELWMRAAGARVAVQVVSMPLVDGNGRVERLLTTLVDVTAVGQTRAAQADLLARTNELLAGDADAQCRPGALARVAVPHFASFCAIELVDDQGCRELAVARAPELDPETAARLEAFEDHFSPAGPGSDLPLVDLRTVGPELWCDGATAQRATGQDAVRSHLLEAAHPASFITVPIADAHGCVGRAMFGTRPPRPAFDAASLPTARALGSIFGSVRRRARLLRGQHDAALLQELLSTVAHDLKNSLAALSLRAQLLLMWGPEHEEERRGEAAAVVRCSEVVLRMATQLLDFDRLDTASRRLDLRDEDARSLVEDALSACEAAARQRRIGLTSEVPPGLRVRCDRAFLLQALVNLIGNAVKFASSGSVRVLCTLGPQEVQLGVEDDGPGIDAAHLQHVFERYWRTKESAGAGLGLFIAKRIIEAHGGHIRIDTAPDRGTTFWFGLARSQS